MACPLHNVYVNASNDPVIDHERVCVFFLLHFGRGVSLFLSIARLGRRPAFFFEIHYFFSMILIDFLLCTKEGMYI